MSFKDAAKILTADVALKKIFVELRGVVNKSFNKMNSDTSNCKTTNSRRSIMEPNPWFVLQVLRKVILKKFEGNDSYSY